MTTWCPDPKKCKAGGKCCGPSTSGYPIAVPPEVKK